jgi:disulfide bond formation protein DsbB
MARGHSYLWTPSLVVLEIATNALISLAAVAISVALARAAARAGVRTTRIAYASLSVFAIGLAAAHALDVWVIWTPAYGIDVVVRCATAVAAVAAAIVLPRMLRRG